MSSNEEIKETKDIGSQKNESNNENNNPETTQEINIELLSKQENQYAKHFIIDKIIPNINLLNLYNLLYSPPGKFINYILNLRGDFQIEYNLDFDKISTQDNFPKNTKFSYKYIHPAAKKILFAPSQFNIEDKYNIVYYNENKLYVECSTFITGFMLMDTFIARGLYIIEQIENDIKINIKYDMEFIKANPFKKIVEDNSYEENNSTYNNIIIPQMEKILKGEIDINKILEEKEKEKEKNEKEKEKNEKEKEENKNTNETEKNKTNKKDDKIELEENEDSFLSDEFQTNLWIYYCSF